jgi:DNA polymerase III subunit delta'
MALLSQIRGQDRAVAVLRRALATGRVAHAYLLCGPAGCGKHTTALALASALCCEDAPGEGCGRCSSCERIASGNHPDVQTLEREGAARIVPIETIRKRVLAQLGHPPHEGRARVFLIEEAASLQSAAANALLKTLEEPPARTHFLLCTTAPDQLLPTIRSRCQRVSLSALAADVRAEIAGDGEAATRADEQVRALASASRSEPGADLHGAAADAARERTEVAALLQTLAQRIHDEARSAALTREPDPQRALARASALARHAGLVLETEIAVTQHNAHAQLAIESLLYRLRAIPVPTAPTSGR